MAAYGTWCCVHLTTPWQTSCHLKLNVAQTELLLFSQTCSSQPLPSQWMFLLFMWQPSSHASSLHILPADYLTCILSCFLLTKPSFYSVWSHVQLRDSTWVSFSIDIKKKKKRERESCWVGLPRYALPKDWFSREAGPLAFSASFPHLESRSNLKNGLLNPEGY